MITLGGTRRQILSILGFAPVAGASSAMQLRALLASPVASAAVAMLAAKQPEMPESPGRTLLGPMLANKLEKLRQDFDEDFWDVKNLRQHGFDADIACLRSVSAVYKARLQQDRDAEFRTTLRAAKSLLWG